MKRGRTVEQFLELPITVLIPADLFVMSMIFIVHGLVVLAFEGGYAPFSLHSELDLSPH